MSDKKVMCHTFLISYSHSRGFGRFFNYREIGKSTAMPSREDIEAMEKKLEGNNCHGVTILSISQVESTMISLSEMNETPVTKENQ